MNAPVGLVACSTLYAEVDQLDLPIDVRYVPQELHESPFDPGDEGAIGRRVSTAIADLLDDQRPHIAIAYATSGPPLVADRTGARIVHWRVDDCIAGLRASPDHTGDGKAPRTYFLSRGWIDRGIDPYKLHVGYRGAAGRLVAWFEDALDGGEAVIDWHEGERFRRLVDRDEPASTDAVDAYFADQLAYFDRVVLLDTGTLLPVHRTYASRFTDFIDRHRGAGGPTELVVEPGSTALLEALVGHDWRRPHPQYGDLVEVIDPAHP